MVSDLKLSAINVDVPQRGGTAVSFYDISKNSIFEASENGTPNIEELELMLEEIASEHGIFLNAWNELKEGLNVGTSMEKCDKAIEDYKKGKITFEEAEKELAKFNAKQSSSLELFSNIATGVAAIGVAAATVATGGVAGIAIGAAAGAATKAGTKLFDRATNKVKDDALDGKQISKDIISGGITGAIGVATAGTGAGVFSKASDASFKTHILNGAKQSAKTGLITGSISGSSGYLLDCNYDDKKFDFGEFAATTATSAAVSGTVGFLMGGTNGGLRHMNLLRASNDNTVTNSISNAAYKITNDRIRAIAS